MPQTLSAAFVFFLFLSGSAWGGDSLPIDCEFHHIWNGPGGEQSRYEVGARISFPVEQPAQARVEFSVRRGGSLHKAQGWISRADLAQAEALLRKKWVWAGVPNGGMVPAVPQKRVILNINGDLHVGLGVEFEEHLPVGTLDRRMGLVRAVLPLSKIRPPERKDPLAIPLVDQRFLVGSADLALPAVPVLVLGVRRLETGTIAHLVVEARDFLDSQIKIARLYLVPPTRLRIAENEAEYSALSNQLFAINYLQHYIRTRQQVLAPWLHRFIDLRKPDEDPSFETGPERFVRRAKNLLVQLGADPDEDEDKRIRSAQVPKTCADYLYLPESD